MCRQTVGLEAWARWRHTTGLAWPGEVDLEIPISFGWLMISNLMKQLEGAITVTREAETTCRLVF